MSLISVEEAIFRAAFVRMNARFLADTWQGDPDVPDVLRARFLTDDTLERALADEGLCEAWLEEHLSDQGAAWVGATVSVSLLRDIGLEVDMPDIIPTPAQEAREHGKDFTPNAVG